MKKMNQDTKDMLISAASAVFMLLIIVSIFYTTQPATEANTYVTNENIIDIKVELSTSKGTNKLYIITSTNRYMLDTGTSNEDVAYELAGNILSSNQQFSITVWKNLTVGLMNFWGNGIWTYQIVDLRDHTNVYWDIDHHNKYQKSERFAGVLLSAIFLAYCVFCLHTIWLFWPRKKKKKKKKKKKTSVTTGMRRKSDTRK